MPPRPRSAPAVVPPESPSPGPTVEAPSIAETPEGRLVFHDGSSAPRPVAGAVLSLTRRCNERCPICIESEEGTADTRDLASGSALALARFFAGRVPTIMSCAGEAVLYPGFHEFAREASARGTTLAVGTNGLAFSNEGVLRDALDAGLRSVLLSCHVLRPDDFDVITGTVGQLDAFLRALSNLDAAMASLPDLEVTLELVVTKRIVGHVEAYLDVVRAAFPSRPPTLRVETMRWINRAVRHPELRPDLREVSQVVDAVLANAQGDLPLVFSFVPLCLLPSAEHLALEPHRILRRDGWLGNRSLDSLEIVEWCRMGNALLAAPFDATCQRCSLRHFCPGAFDVPVPDDLDWPRPSTAEVGPFLDRLDTTGVERERALALVEEDRDPAVNPRLRADRAAGNRAVCACQDEPVRRRRPSLPSAERVALAKTVKRAKKRFPGLRVEQGDAELSLWLPSSTAREAELALFIASGVDEPFYKAAGPFRLRYSGSRTPALEAVVDFLVAALTPR